MIRTPAVILMTISALAVAAPAQATQDKAAEVFTAIYGKRTEEVSKTPSTADDLLLAAELLKEAHQSVATPDLMRLLCEQAEKIASRDPAGADVMVGAIELLSQQKAMERPDALNRISIVRQKQLATAKSEQRLLIADELLHVLAESADLLEEKEDMVAAIALHKRCQSIAASVNSTRLPAIQNSIERLTHEHATQTRIAALQAKVLQNANDAKTALELIVVLVTEQDAINEAARYADRAKDDVTTRALAAAARGISTLTEAEALLLGDWYGHLSSKASTRSKRRVLEKAVTCYGRYLEQHTTVDLDRRRVELTIKTMQAEIGRLPVVQETKSAKLTSVVELLNPVDLKRDVLGRWRKTELGIACDQGKGAAIATLPVVINGDYELKMSFRRLRGDDTVGAILPVGGTTVLLSIDSWPSEGTWTALEPVDQQPAFKNVTGRKGIRLKNGQTHELTVIVRSGIVDAEIDAHLDGVNIIRWKGKRSALGMGKPWMANDPRSIAIGTWECEVEWLSASLKMLSGNARSAR